jgi:acyl-ACP thioesterase
VLNAGQALDDLVPIPARGRTFSAARAVRLSDMDVRGRVRLDAVARYLQDVAIEDVDETGWGLPEHVWFIRSVRIDVLAPFLRDRRIELVTWCSGLASLAAGRRWSLAGDAGGQIEVDSVWIHLGPDQRPRRLDGFEVYGEAAGDRRVTTKAELASPEDGVRTRWHLRSTDVDLHGHVNNAVYWQAVEERLAEGMLPDVTRPLRARLEYRRPLDLDDRVELVERSLEGRLELAFVTALGVSAVARVDPL